MFPMMLKGAKALLILIGLGSLAICLFASCVKTTRIVMDKDGKVIEKTSSWEPIVVNTYPTYSHYPERVYYNPDPIYYGPPVVYERPIVYGSYYRPVVYRTSYYRPVREVRTVYVGGERHYRGPGGHSRRHR